MKEQGSPEMSRRPWVAGRPPVLGGDGGGEEELLTGFWWPLSIVPVCISSTGTVAQLRSVHQSVASEGSSR